MSKPGIWTQTTLQALVDDQIEENLRLEYKGAGSLEKDPRKRNEITKDVSAFANSAGGTLIYGIAECTDKEQQHLPSHLDPVDRSRISRETLEHVILNIQPRIDGLRIHPVAITVAPTTGSETDGSDRVCYVVEIPASDTAHQAADHRYYKRHNFNSVPMEDYEVRDTMNRKIHPRIRVSIRLNLRRPEQDGLILAKIENIGRVLARHSAVVLQIPLLVDGVVISPEQPAVIDLGDEVRGDFWTLTLVPDRPLFPNSAVIIHRSLSKPSEFRLGSGRTPRAMSEIEVVAYADEMPALRGQVYADAALRDFVAVPVNQPNQSD